MEIKELLIPIETKLVQEMLKEFDKSRDTSQIKYDWDGGHCYSYIESPAYAKLMELEVKISRDMFDMIDEHCNEWMYEWERRPPCEIHIFKNGLSRSMCGCHDDNTKEEVEEAVSELESYCKEHNEEIEYCITREI